MSEPFLGEIKIVAFNFPPKGWTFCNGQLLPINQNQALFSLLGTTYGGNGTSNFALPNLQGMAPMHFGNGAGLTPRSLGETAGSTAVTLLPTEMPSHTHTMTGTSAAGSASTPASALTLASGVTTYAPPADTGAMAAQALTPAGGGQPHNNRQPYLGLNFIIALAGIFPSRS
jgi:microcystin-dependent protein